MSAYILNREALSNLAFELVRILGPRRLPWHKFLRHGKRLPRTRRRLAEVVFHGLLRQNIHSVVARYGWDGRVFPQGLAEWEYLPPSPKYLQQPPDIHRLCLLCDVYNYQASETRNYFRSALCQTINTLRMAAGMSLVKTNDLDWNPCGTPLPLYVSKE